MTLYLSFTKVVKLRRCVNLRIESDYSNPSIIINSCVNLHAGSDYSYQPIIIDRQLHQPAYWERLFISVNNNSQLTELIHPHCYFFTRVRRTVSIVGYGG